MALLVAAGWCAVMGAYLAIYGAFEANALPVTFEAGR